MMTSCYTQATERLQRLVFAGLERLARTCSPRRIVVKPNWVLHETDPAFPISALVTDARVIEAVVESCLKLFPDAESILVGDCPLQWADWPWMCHQCGLQPIIDRLSKASGGKVVFRDLRKEVFRRDANNFLVPSHDEHGDPLSYREVELGCRSHLEEISGQSDKFAVNDYSSAITGSNHRQGSHRYFVSQSVLEADLLINLPKWKSHQKSGLPAP